MRSFTGTPPTNARAQIRAPRSIVFQYAQFSAIPSPRPLCCDAIREVCRSTRLLLFAIVSLWPFVVPNYCLAQLQNSAVFFHTCDASAGIALGDRLFAVASDEDNWLRIYDRKQPGDPIQTVNLAPLLAVSSDKEMDIEAATQIGDTSFWIASHGAKSDGTPAPSRQIIFALHIQVTDDRMECSRIGTPYRHLLNDLTSEPELARYQFGAASSRAPKDSGGLNIEGLCSIDDQLLIGFRNPIPDGKALLLPLLNPRDVLGIGRAQPTSAKFGKAIELDLGGRGVRSIEYDPRARNFLIVAGAIDGTRDFALYRWQGPGNLPRKLEIKFGKWNPEALLIWPGQLGAYQILSDDGERIIDDIDEDTPCKELPLQSRRFRSGWITSKD